MRMRQITAVLVSLVLAAGAAFAEPAKGAAAGAGGKLATPQEWAVAVDIGVLEGFKFGVDAGVTAQHPGHVHHFGEAQGLGVGCQRGQLGGADGPRAVGLHGGSGHAGAQHDP